MPPITDRLKALKKEPQGPLWKGPHEDGITQSMLQKFLACRERFRVAYVLGLQPVDGFNHRLEYGSMWHACEEAFHNGNEPDWRVALDNYCISLAQKYPLSHADIRHWRHVCAAQFNAYIDVDGGKWSEMSSQLLTKDSRCLFQERTFDEPFELPSGRVVRLRGKWDGVWVNPSNTTGGVVPHCILQENKTKGDIKPEQLRRQLTFDLQTMFYCVAMDQAGYTPRGVIYNVIRRPLSGGRHTIVQKKGSKNIAPESSAEFYERLSGLIAADPEYFFMRWDVRIQEKDLQRFKTRFLIPILEQLCGWWEWIQALGDDPFEQPENNGGIHWQHPYGCYNALNEGGSSDYDAYLMDGNPTGLRRAKRLFTELE